MKSGIALALFVALGAVMSCETDNGLHDRFENPPAEYRPMPLWHLNGHLTEDAIRRQIVEAKEKSGFGGMTVLPVSPMGHWYDGHLCPGMTPEYLSDEYFRLYGKMLEVSAETGQQIILYDDIDFPTGSAGGRLLREYPQYCRKYLEKSEFEVDGGTAVNHTFQLGETQSWIALSAMNTETLEIIDLEDFLSGNTLEWKAPEGRWKVMAFTIRYNVGAPHGHLVDYMDPEAVSKLMEMTYDQYDSRFSAYFGNVITKTFFDDIGFVFMEQTWNKAISELFRKQTGKNPALYYPALFYDIGPETRAARVAFHNARAELMAEGYIKSISEWAAERNMKSMGHPPENYSPNTVVTCGDLLKFYRHAQIPLLDVIFWYGRGRDGYKQITSAADREDKGIVGAELNGAFPETMDSLDLYRVAMESMARGVNFIVPHGLWYDSDPDSIRIPPLISWENPRLGDAVMHYSEFTSRSCVMLQEGKRVVDIAMLWPIQAVQAESYMYRDMENYQSGNAPIATWLPDSVNNYRLSNVLTDQLKRDFTYVHPEDFVDGKVFASGNELILNNRVNRQTYQVLIMPGGAVLSAETFAAIKSWYDEGGKVIATGSLPKWSAEFGRDSEITGAIHEIFGKYPDRETFAKNDNGGIFAFLPLADANTLGEALSRMGVTADVSFEPHSLPSADIGCINYTHKQKDGYDIYYFINTTESPLSTVVTLRGKVRRPELWDPHTGLITKIHDSEYEVKRVGEDYYTDINLCLDPSRSTFIVGKH